MGTFTLIFQSNQRLIPLKITTVHLFPSNSGLVGGAWVEAPHVSSKGKVIAWDVMFAPGRPFATDMAGFAINVKELFRARVASFNHDTVPKTYKQLGLLNRVFLRSVRIQKDRLEPIRATMTYPKEILVWHTRTSKSKTRGPKRGYAIESSD
ncbi:glycosyltransferase family 43 [Cooperia oncophora]